MDFVVARALAPAVLDLLEKTFHGVTVRAVAATGRQHKCVGAALTPASPA
jgi:hypothetical protein